MYQNNIVYNYNSFNNDNSTIGSNCATNINNNLNLHNHNNKKKSKSNKRTKFSIYLLVFKLDNNSLAVHVRFHTKISYFF